MVERCPDKTEVVGSIPTARTAIEKAGLISGIFFCLEIGENRKPDPAYGGGGGVERT